MDPLSQILRFSEAHVAVSTGLVATGHWSVYVPPTNALKCNVLREGECLLEVEGRRHRLTQGDCFLVAPDRPFLIGADLSHPRPASEVFAGSGNRPFARLDVGDGPIARIVGGRMQLGQAADLLERALPPLVILPVSHPASARIGWLLDRLEEEQFSGSAGAATIGTAIMQIVFVELIRSLPQDAPAGWLAALSDPRIGPVLRAIHAEPSHPWRLEELAATANFSRSQFSQRFREAVGLAPMDYVLRWRMAVARQALAQPGATVAGVAAGLGYASESAFGAAFRRVMGTSPRRAAIRANGGIDSHPEFPMKEDGSVR
ncbi:MAG: AraC family transcriptional regulator [Rhizobiales bacterium]|nr:AraC family transcriptional regulator [Hyphomicrobiales bacterium]